MMIDANGHPLRRQLGLTRDRSGAREAPRPRDYDDFKLFLLSYTAFFICFYTFLL